MNAYHLAFLSLTAIFFATALGSGMVFLLKRNLKERVSNMIFGFTSGIMFSASIFGLIIPAIDSSASQYRLSFIPVVSGILLGSFFLFFLDFGLSRSGKKKGNVKFFTAVTTHNIPEGLAIGLSYSLSLCSSDPTYLLSAISLTIGIALQNIPESLAVSLTLYESGLSKGKSFLLGVLSGIVEPIFGLIGLFLSVNIDFLLPWLLSFAGGAMIYITIDELIPGSKKEGQPLYGVWAFILGFCLMIILETL